MISNRKLPEARIMSKAKVCLTVVLLIAFVIGIKLLNHFPVKWGGEKAERHVSEQTMVEIPGREEITVHENKMNTLASDVVDQDEARANQEIIEEYQYRYGQFEKKLIETEFDSRGISETLRRRLKETEDGKLSREEILELLPPEAVKEYLEMLDVLSKLDRRE